METPQFKLSINREPANKLEAHLLTVAKAWCDQRNVQPITGLAEFKTKLEKEVAWYCFDHKKAKASSVLIDIYDDQLIYIRPTSVADKTATATIRAHSYHDDDHAAYSWGFDLPILWIKDEGGAKSVTNDIRSILIDIAHQIREDILDKFIMYRDSMGIWDCVTAQFEICEMEGTFSHNGRGADVSIINFVPLSETDFELAKIKLLRR